MAAMGRLPRVTISFAQSLDGRIATLSGHSQWISGKRSLRLAQKLRGDHELILAGIGTVLRDDPRLTCRLPGLPLARSPVRVVLDSRLRLPLQSAIVRTAGERARGRVPVLVCTTQSAPEERKRALEACGVRVAVLPAGEDGRVEIRSVMEFLGLEGFRSLFVEGGGEVITAFLRAGMVHRLLVVVAPIIIGHGVAAVGDLGVRTLEQALRPARCRVHRLGADRLWELEFDGP
jgi:5-amino-6-(5-phosphoribosylamino)uracil reductase/diaminohydroxyphosphoribosylaminopyrimidine deaminase/5-amino-6-(5-phosphoribosylamino)uracil reductase